MMEMWRLDCGEVHFTDFNAFFSDASEYPAGPKRLVASCYLIRHGTDYMLWDTGLPAALVGNPNSNAAMTASLRASIVDQLARRSTCAPSRSRSSASAIIISIMSARRRASRMRG